MMHSIRKIMEVLASDFYNSSGIKATGSLTEYGSIVGLYTGNYLVSIQSKSYNTMIHKP